MECRFFTLIIVYSIFSCTESYGSLNFTSLHDIFNLSVIRDDLFKIFNDLETKINKTYYFLRYNWMLDPVCANEFEECNSTLTCCDEDLACYYSASNNSSRCTNISADWVNDTQGEDIDQHMMRLNDLTYDINYRDWANGFEFESKSAMRREEEKAKEEKIWREKYKQEKREERKWLPLLKTLIEKSKRKWNEIQKMKKLKEVKNILKEKIAARKHEDSLDSNDEATPAILTNSLESKEEEPENRNPPQDFKNSAKEDSKELRKKTYPGLDQLMKDADDVVKQHREREKEKFSSEERTTSEKQRSSEIAQIEDTEDKLEEELTRLKALQNEQKKETVVSSFEDTKKEEIKELIKKQVALILEQERKLSGLMKLNELKKMQDTLNAQGGNTINAQQ